MGKGGCGTVLVEGGNKKETRLKHVGRLVDNVDCEVASMVVALEMVEKYYQEESHTNEEKIAFILNDCKSALQIVCKQREAENREDMFKQIWEIADKISKMNVKLKFCWVPGHAGIEFNEEADRAAKSGARLPDNEEKVLITYSSIKKMINDLMMKEWKDRWKRVDTGGETKVFLKEVGVQLIFPKVRSTGMSYVRCLLNNTSLNDTLKKFKLVDSATCDCNRSRETVEHVILNCSLYENERQILISEMAEIWRQEKLVPQGFNLKTVLYPQSYKKNSRIVSNKLLTATFRFLAAIKNL